MSLDQFFQLFSNSRKHLGPDETEVIIIAQFHKKVYNFICIFHHKDVFPDICVFPGQWLSMAPDPLPELG